MWATGEGSADFDQSDIIIKRGWIEVRVVDDLTDWQSLLVGVKRGCWQLFSHSVSSTCHFLSTRVPEIIIVTEQLGFDFNKKI